MAIHTLTYCWLSKDTCCSHIVQMKLWSQYPVVLLYPIIYVSQISKKIEGNVTVSYRGWLMKLNSLFFLGDSARYYLLSHLTSGIGNKKTQKYWFLLVPLILNDRSLWVPLSQRSYNELHWLILSFEIVVLSPVSILLLCWYRESIYGPL